MNKILRFERILRVLLLPGLGKSGMTRIVEEILAMRSTSSLWTGEIAAAAAMLELARFPARRRIGENVGGEKGSEIFGLTKMPSERVLK